MIRLGLTSFSEHDYLTGKKNGPRFMNMPVIYR